MTGPNPSPHPRLALRCSVSVLAFALVGIGYTASAHAVANRVTAFGVTDYAPCNQSSLPNSANAADDFFNDLQTFSNGGWQAGFLKKNSSVRGRSMADTEWSGNALNADSNSSHGFEYFGGINMFQGHGVGGAAMWRDGVSGRPLDSCPTGDVADECGAGVGGTYDPAVCLRYPRRSPCPDPTNDPCNLSNTPFCAYQYDHQLVVCRSGEGGVNFVHHSMTDPFGEAPREMRLGEFGTPWAEAGADGTTQLAVLFTSHTLHMGAPGMNVHGMMGGVDLLLATWTHWGDYADTADRAPTFAQILGAFPGHPVAQIMVAAAPLVNSANGCRGWKTDGTAHQGINGCGGHILMAMDSTNQRASNTLFGRTPAALQDATVTPQGNTARAYLRLCNYDCATYPPLISAERF